MTTSEENRCEWCLHTGRWACRTCTSYLDFQEKDFDPATMQLTTQADIKRIQQPRWFWTEPEENPVDVLDRILGINKESED